MSMTRSEAQAEAQRRWPRGFAHHVSRGRPDPWYEVGTIGMWPEIMGRGASWEAAFTDADRRKGEQT